MNLSQKSLQKLITTCPHCQAEFEQLDRTLIHESRTAKLLHVRCRTCQSSLVTLLFSTGPLISSIGLVTDLSREDVVKFQLTTQVSEDDLFALHHWLQQPTAIYDLMQ